MKCHIISHGEYSDWTIDAILLAQPDKDFAALVAEFDGAIGLPNRDDFDEGWHERHREYFAARDDAVAAFCERFGMEEDEDFSRGHYLAAWLKKAHGYVGVEWDDTNSEYSW